MDPYHQQAPYSNSIYVTNLPPGTTEELLEQHFGSVGLLKKDRRTGMSSVWMYRDKATNRPKGDASITYEDPMAAAAAVDWFDNKEFHGSFIRVSLAQSDRGAPAPAPVENLGYNDYGGYPREAEEVPTAGYYPNENRGRLEGGGRPGYGGGDYEGGGGGGGRSGYGDGDLGGGGRSGYGGGRGGRGGDGGGPAKQPWRQDGDWLCPNPSCGNVNFAFRGQCNKCQAPRPANATGVVGGGRGAPPGMGRGDGRGGRAGGGGRGGREGGRGPGGPPGLFGPGDWVCPMCQNTNWAKRLKCNICMTAKPGTADTGPREGRGGGFKEYDEAEIEETKRRRKQMEEDDGEMYDEFGNLKKKFRAKAGYGSEGASGPRMGGESSWKKEDLGFGGGSRDRAWNNNSQINNHNNNRWEDDRSQDKNGRNWEADRYGGERYRDDRSRERDRHYMDNRDGRDRGRERERDLL